MIKMRYKLHKHTPTEQFVVYKEAYDTDYECVLAFKGVFEGTKKECQKWIHQKEVSNNEIKRN